MLGRRHDLLQRGSELLRQYSRIQQLYPRSAVKNHRIVFWSDAVDNLSSDTSAETAQGIKDAHDEMVQSEDSSVNGARKRLIKAKSGCLASQIDEPREGLRAKLQELNRRKCQEDMVFKESELSEKAIELATAELEQFTHQHDPRLAYLILVGVFIQNYTKSLTMEGFVANAGHKLASTNSECGDWFFEELRSVYANQHALQHQLISISARINPELKTQLNLQDITLTSMVYTKLAKLYSEWKGYIVPEAISLLQIEEATSLIDAIINLAYSQPISKLSSHLSSVLKTGQSDNQTLTEQYIETTLFLENQFEQLCGGLAENTETPGIMLIKLCNQMFREITENTEQLVASFFHLDIPARWETSIAAAKTLIRNKTYDSHCLRRLLFLRQLEALSSFFSLVRANAVSFISQQQDSSLSPKLHSEEELTKPIKVFIANFIQEVLLGVPSYAMGRASCALMEVGLNEELNMETTTTEDSSNLLWTRIKTAISNLYPEDVVTTGSGEGLK